MYDTNLIIAGLELFANRRVDIYEKVSIDAKWVTLRSGSGFDGTEGGHKSEEGPAAPSPQTTTYNYYNNHGVRGNGGGHGGQGHGGSNNMYGSFDGPTEMGSGGQNPMIMAKSGKMW